MAKKRKPMTAAEYLALVADDPDYQRMMRKKEAARRALENELARDEESLVSDLREAGLRVGSVWDLVNTNEPYPEAIPILADHLGREHHPRTREGIIRALITPDPTGVAPSVLLPLFMEMPESPSEEKAIEMRWLVASALAASSVTDSDVRKLIPLLLDPAIGKAREALLPILARLPSEDRQRIIESLAEDQQLAPLLKKYV